MPGTPQKRIRKKVSAAVSIPRIAKVPPRSFHDDYVSRDVLPGTSDFEVFDYAHTTSTNVLIEGPTGPGKTSAVMAWAAKNDLPFYAVPSNQGVEPSQLFGKFIPSPDGGFEWQDGPVTDLVRHGGVLLINEINFVPERIATVLFSLLDKRRQIALLDHRAEVIDAAPGLLIVADMNPDYEGTRPLNKALRNRFGIQLFWDYDPQVEAALISSSALLDLARNLRKESRESNIDTPLSTNMLMEFETIAKGPLGLDFAIENLVNHFTAEERVPVRNVFTVNVRELKRDLGQRDRTKRRGKRLSRQAPDTPETDDDFVFAEDESA